MHHSLCSYKICKKYSSLGVGELHLWTFMSIHFLASCYLLEFHGLWRRQAKAMEEHTGTQQPILHFTGRTLPSSLLLILVCFQCKSSSRVICCIYLSFGKSLSLCYICTSKITHSLRMLNPFGLSNVARVFIHSFVHSSNDLYVCTTECLSPKYLLYK